MKGSPFALALRAILDNEDCLQPNLTISSSLRRPVDSATTSRVVAMVHQRPQLYSSGSVSSHELVSHCVKCYRQGEEELL